jgi:hypothetical protein
MRAPPLCNDGRSVHAQFAIDNGYQLVSTRFRLSARLCDICSSLFNRRMPNWACILAGTLLGLDINDHLYYIGSFKAYSEKNFLLGLQVRSVR